MPEMKKNYIKCRWLEKGRIVVNPDGQVHPCCYFGNYHYIQSHENKDKYKSYWENTPSQSLFNEYEKEKENLNINNKSMVDILMHKWYDETLPDSWKKQETRNEICIRFCQHEE